MKIPLRDKIGYGVGNFSSGISLQIIGTYLVFYSTAIHDIPGSFIGIAVSLSIVWDAVTDPLMGYVSDITHSKAFGRRHLYLLIGSIGTAVANIILWSIGLKFPVLLKFSIIFVDILVIKTFMTIYATPYTALGAELSFDYNERTTIQGIKTIFFLVGLAFVSVAGMYIFFQPTPEFPVGQLNPAAYRNMGFVSSAVIMICALICFFTTKKYIPHLPQNEMGVPHHKKILRNLMSHFKKALKNKAFFSVAISYMFINISSALLSNIGLHVFTYTFMLNNEHIAFIIGVQLLVSIVSQPVWSLISRKIDKKPSMILGLGLCILGGFIFLLLVFLKDFVSGNPICFMPFSVLAGFGTGGLFMLPLSMVADTIDLEELHSGVRLEGVYYGGLTLLYKLSQSVAVFLLGFILDIVHFNSDLPVQPEVTVLTLGIILGVGSIVTFMIALICVIPYPLNREKVMQIQQQIQRKQIE